MLARRLDGPRELVDAPRRSPIARVTRPPPSPRPPGPRCPQLIRLKMALAFRLRSATRHPSRPVRKKEPRARLSSVSSETLPTSPGLRLALAAAATTSGDCDGDCDGDRVGDGEPLVISSDRQSTRRAQRYLSRARRQQTRLLIERVDSHRSDRTRAHSTSGPRGSSCASDRFH